MDWESAVSLNTTNVCDIIFLTSHIKIKAPDSFLILTKTVIDFMFPKLLTYRNSKVKNISVQKSKIFYVKEKLKLIKDEKW